MHIRVPRLIYALGRATRANDGGIHNGAGIDLETSGLEFPSNLDKLSRPHLVVVEQFAMLGDGRGVRHWFPPQVNAKEAAQTGAVAQRFLASQVCKVEPMLDEMDAQHSLKADGCLEVVGLDDFAQCCPRHDRLHALQELIAPRGFAVVLERLLSCHGKGLLFHLCVLSKLPVGMQITG